MTTHADPDTTAEGLHCIADSIGELSDAIRALATEVQRLASITRDGQATR